MLEKVKHLLEQKAPLIVAAFQEGASSEAIENIQSLVKKELPDGLIELYRECNGLDPNKIVNFAYGMTFYPIEHSFSELNDVKEGVDKNRLKFADAGIKPDYTFGPLRIPIGSDSGRCRVCVDLDPDKNGVYGQIIFIDDGYRIALKLNNSIEDYIAQFEKDLEANKYPLMEDALGNGYHWLDPISEIDPGNCFSSPSWAYVKKAMH